MIVYNRENWYLWYMIKDHIINDPWYDSEEDIAASYQPTYSRLELSEPGYTPGWLHTNSRVGVLPDYMSINIRAGLLPDNNIIIRAGDLPEPSDIPRAGHSPGSR